MKKLTLLLVFLLCTPMLFATDIDKLFKKWTKEYPESSTELWEKHNFTDEENQRIAKELGLTGVKGKKATALETSSATVIAAMKNEMTTCTPAKGFKEILKKSYPNVLDIYVYAKKDGEEWVEAYLVVFDNKQKKGVAANVTGSIPNSLYEQYYPMIQMMLDQTIAQMK